MMQPEIVALGPERAPAIRVRYHRRDDPKRTQTAWVVIACPFCDKPHRHSSKVNIGDVVAAGCGRSRTYRLGVAEVS